MQMQSERLQEYIDRMSRDLVRDYSIPAEMYENQDIKRGLRNNDGTGVLVGISKVGSVQGLSLIHILRHGIKTVIIPAENEKDLEEIDQTVRQSLNFITVSHVDSVIAAALVSGEAPAEAPVLDAMPAMPPVTPKARRKPGIRQ